MGPPLNLLDQRAAGIGAAMALARAHAHRRQLALVAAVEAVHAIDTLLLLFHHPGRDILVPRGWSRPTLKRKGPAHSRAGPPKYRSQARCPQAVAASASSLSGCVRRESISFGTIWRNFGSSSSQCRRISAARGLPVYRAA